MASTGYRVIRHTHTHTQGANDSESELRRVWGDKNKLQARETRQRDSIIHVNTRQVLRDTHTHSNLCSFAIYIFTRTGQASISDIF